MEPFALMTLMRLAPAMHWIFYLLLLVLGAVIRMFTSTKREFRIVAGVSAGVYVLSEVVADIVFVNDSWMPAVLSDAAFAAGPYVFWFAAGYLVTALICSLTHKKQLA